jgi:hypothetical protein
MSDKSSNIQELLFALAAKAEEIELSRQLTILGGQFDRYSAGALSVFELDDAVDQFVRNDSTNRTLWYKNNPPKKIVARAVALGVLSKSDIPAHVMEEIQPLLQFYKDELLHGDQNSPIENN